MNNFYGSVLIYKLLHLRGGYWRITFSCIPKSSQFKTYIHNVKWNQQELRCPANDIFRLKFNVQ